MTSWFVVAPHSLFELQTSVTFIYCTNADLSQPASAGRLVSSALTEERSAGHRESTGTCLCTHTWDTPCMWNAPCIPSQTPQQTSPLLQWMTDQKLGSLSRLVTPQLSMMAPAQCSMAPSQGPGPLCKAQFLSMSSFPVIAGAAVSSSSITCGFPESLRGPPANFHTWI